MYMYIFRSVYTIVFQSMIVYLLVFYLICSNYDDKGILGMELGIIVVMFWHTNFKFLSLYINWLRIKMRCRPFCGELGIHFGICFQIQYFVIIIGTVTWFAFS